MPACRVRVRLAAGAVTAAALVELRQLEGPPRFRVVGPSSRRRAVGRTPSGTGVTRVPPATVGSLSPSEYPHAPKAGQMAMLAGPDSRHDVNARGRISVRRSYGPHRQ